MQQNSINKIISGITAIFWVAGLLIAGSENDYMPLFNCLGLVIFAVSSILLGYLLNTTAKKESLRSQDRKRILQPVKYKTNKRALLDWRYEKKLAA